MRDSLTSGQEPTQKLVETLINAGVVSMTAADGELLLELYSLLECLEPDEQAIAARLSRVRFVSRRTPDLGLYLVYIPLSDVITHLLPVSTRAGGMAEHLSWGSLLNTDCSSDCV
jgi:hypothetical protein